MTTDAIQSRLRLVRPPAPLVRSDDEALPSARARKAYEREVANANRASSTMPMEQARTIFTARIAESLEGGRSAILRPEARTRLIDLATRMGIRPFDAHLVIAMTQDAARRGEMPVSSGDQAETGADPSWWIPPAFALAVAITMGVGLAMLGIVWIAGPGR